MTFKRLLSIGAIAATITVPNLAHAQITTINPNGIGGYNTYTPGEPMTQTMPNGAGGYNQYTPGEPPTMIQPNGVGGYNVYSPPRLPNLRLKIRPFNSSDDSDDN